MLEQDIVKIKEKLKENKKIVFIGSKRSNDDDLKIYKKEFKDAEFIYYDDYYFLPLNIEDMRNLSEHVVNKIEEVKTHEAATLIITSKRISTIFGRRIARMLGDVELYMPMAGNALDKPIVVLDSGIGGINVASKLQEMLPSENIIAITDQKNMPYGNKDSRIVSRRAINIVKRIKSLNPKCVVLACNTIDSVVGDKLDAQLGGIELIRIISATAKKAAKTTKNKEVGLIATPATVQSQKYMIELLNYSSSTHMIGLECLDLATEIENSGDIKKTFNEETQPLTDFDIDTLILGCTHYTKVVGLAKKKFTDVNIIDSAEIVIEETINYLEKTHQQKNANTGNLYVYSTKIDEEIEDKIEKNIKGEFELFLMEV